MIMLSSHLCSIPNNSPHIQEVQEAIEQFFTKNLLHWIEVLVIVESLSVGIHAINDVEQWCSGAGTSCEWANDSRRFLLENFNTIHNSPSQIYHSALPFLPSSSWLHKHYGIEFLQEVRVLQGLPARWGECSRTVSMGGPMKGISSWNDTIAVGFGYGDIVTLDAITGSQTATFSGHTDEVKSVTFSSDGKSLVSGSSDKTVKLWDVQTGGVVATFIGHTSSVFSVSISVDHTTIATGSYDKTLRLWDIQTGECLHVMKQMGIVRLVSFSPTDPQYFLSMSWGNVSQ